ncbi:MAG: hypothetical protein BA872_05380 [Desulfobacterales bacterium C00003060]|nr:MAG: hypothetical protein BA872_05380 [Desulfobacterales bacterium C00003060]OEU82887.1 MAG: hypothetical protein BA865_15330 [Desulfobacterales bacterium S5133MH4]
MDYLKRPCIIPDNRTVMSRQNSLVTFFGKLGEMVVDYCKFDMTKTMPVKVECPDESQGLKILYFIGTFGTSPFVGGKLGAELDTKAIVPASHHAENLVYVMGSHTGYDHKTRTWGKIYREKEGGFSPCCGKLAGVIGPYLQEYEYAKNSINLFKEEGRVFLEIPNRLLGIHSSDEPYSAKLCLERFLIRGNAESEGVMTAEDPRSVIFEIHPNLQHALEAKKRNITHDPAPIGDDLTGDYFKYLWITTAPFPDNITRRLHPLMHQIVSSSDFPPMVTVANVQTWIEFNRFVDAIHAIPDVLSKGVFGVSGLTVDLYFEDRTYGYSNVYYPQYAFFKTPGQREGIVMGPSEINNLMDSYTPKQRLSIDQILECNDKADEKIEL